MEIAPATAVVEVAINPRWQPPESRPAQSFNLRNVPDLFHIDLACGQLRHQHVFMLKSIHRNASQRVTESLIQAIPPECEVLADAVDIDRFEDEGRLFM